MSITDRHKRSFIESLSVKKVGNRSALADVVTKSRETFSETKCTRTSTCPASCRWTVKTGRWHGPVWEMTRYSRPGLNSFNSCRAFLHLADQRRRRRALQSSAAVQVRSSRDQRGNPSAYTTGSAICVNSVSLIAQFTPPARQDKTALPVSCLAWRCKLALSFIHTTRVHGP